MPIASITKLMTAMVVLDARLPLDELIAIDAADVDTLKHSGSRLRVGTVLPRRSSCAWRSWLPRTGLPPRLAPYPVGLGPSFAP